MAQPKADVDVLPIVSSKLWFVRGFAVCMLLFAAINAGSYFVRTSDWSNLVLPGRGTAESLGFPLVMWEKGNLYGGFFVDYVSLGWNVLVGAIVSTIVGLLVVSRSDFLNELARRLEPTEHEAGSAVQFSIRGMMATTLVVAVAVALAKNFAARSETLVAIYAAGPVVLVAIAMLPRNLAWEKRVAILVPTAILMMAVAIVVGAALKMEFDKVLFGIFICWTPQSALAALAVSIGLLATGPPESSAAN
jgi:hypothetical protein